MSAVRLAARVAAAAVLAEVVVTPGLWLPDGWLAPLPVWASAAPALAAWHASTALLALACGWLVARGGSRHTWALATALLGLRCGLDRALWQTYTLEQLAFFAAAAVARPDDERAVAGALRAALGLVFVWAGVHKLNPSFLDGGLRPWLGATPPGFEACVALGEALLGVALLWPPARRAAAAALATFSCAVALALWRDGSNRAVVPWNLEHAALAWVLFRDEAAAAHARHPFALAVAAVFGALPALHPMGYPPYLALRVYTADSTQATLFVDDAARLPAAARAVAEPDASGTFGASLSIARWSRRAIGAYLPPDAATFAAIERRVCAASADPSRVLMVLTTPRGWWRAPRTTYTRCAPGPR